MRYKVKKLKPKYNKENLLTPIEKVISKALMDSDISHEEFMVEVNKHYKYIRLKENL